MADNGIIRKIDWSIAPDEIQSSADKLISEAKEELDKLAKTPTSEASVETLQIFEEILATINEMYGHFYFIKNVSTDKAQRDVCGEVEKQVEKFFNEVWSRNDLYEILVQLEPQIESFGPEERTLLEKTLVEFQHRGAALQEEQRMEFLEIANNISVLESDFSRVINEITDTVPFTVEELEGVPPEIYESLEKKGDVYNFPLDNPYSNPVIYYAKNPESRKRMQLAVFSKGGKENSERLQDTLALRERQAKLLGHSNYAEYSIKRKMAKTPERVVELMDDLKTKMTPLSEKEVEGLKKLKAKDLGIPFDTVELEIWDLFYYHELQMKEEYSVDQNEVKKYFPVAAVVKGVLDVYQKVLNLEFKESDTPNIWHEDVREFLVIDKVTGNKLGIFYLDLFPREGKYKHYAVFTIMDRRVKNGKALLPITSQVSNFQKPTDKQPSLLTHREVVTYFHEFGHLMHAISNQATYQRFGLNGVLSDFIEVPSNIFENWAWKEEILAQISGHYMDSDKKLPSNLLKSMIDAKLQNIGTFQLRQVFFSSIDILYHTKGAEDTTAVWNNLFHDITGFTLHADSRRDASFTHIMGGYQAGYYSYTWSRVYAEDLFTKFEGAGFMDAKTGLEYRQKVLAPGGSKHPDEMVRDF
ncbi:MAG: M3 family metallopeptidase, partial [Candidatus Thorarchaeota archaeon]